MQIPSKRWLHIFGGMLSLVGVVFVLLRLSTYVEQIDLPRFNLADWSFILLLALAYGTANILLACAWWHVLAFLDVKIDLRWAVKVYGLSQLARYVPGNIFHFAGRQALCMAEKLPAWAVAKSVIWELWIVAIAGVLFGILTLPLVWTNLPVWVSLVMFLVMSISLIIALHHLLSASVGVALICHISFLSISGVVFIGTLGAVVTSGNMLPAFTVLCGAYVIAWLCGLITPGAPAGVGVRELVLLFLLEKQIAQADLLMAVVLGRMVTVVGDLFFFSVASVLRRRFNKPG